jgi:DNA polymerase-3 subunit epsilon
MKNIEITIEGLTLLTELNFKQINEINGFYNMEVYFTDGFSGNKHYLFQVLGSLGAFARDYFDDDTEERLGVKTYFDDEIQVIIISDAIMNNPDSALYSDFKSKMESKLNKKPDDESEQNKKNTPYSYRKIKFITETHLIKYIENRRKIIDNPLIKETFDKYKTSARQAKSKKNKNMTESMFNYTVDKDYGENKCNLDFVAIDFETANESRDSVCEIGLAIVKGGKIVNNPSWLVRPRGNYYSEFNISIHGIRPEDTEDKPSFEQLWEEIRPLIDGQVLIAHNASFDMYVLWDVLDLYSLDYPDLQTMCSCSLARRVYPGLWSYSLGVVCDHLGISLENHHRAGDDAAACAEIAIKAFTDSGISDFSMILDKLRIIMGKMDSEKQTYTGHRSKPIKASEITGDPSKHNPDNLFYGKRVVFTGALSSTDRKSAMQIIADIGGIPEKSVTLRTDILVVGQQDFRIVGEDGMSTKQEKAMELIEKGHHIEIMPESDFMENISKEIIL